MRFTNVIGLLRSREKELKRYYDEETNPMIKNDLGMEILEVQDAIRVLDKPTA